MKNYALLTLALVLVASTVAVAGVYLVGGTPNSNNTIPFWGGYAACRWQTLWWQEEIKEAAPVIKIEWQVWSSGAGRGGTFSKCDILLCHTKLRAVTSTYNNNYGGNTPVNVYSGTFVLPASSANQWMTIVEPKNFTYNNTDSLLIEVSWEGSTGSTTPFKCRSGSTPAPGRLYNMSSKTATTGSVTAAWAEYARLTLGYVGVAPTSLGRVKSLFR